MAQLDVHRLKRGGVALVVDLQHGLLASLRTRIVAPLRPWTAGEASFPAITPMIELDGERFVLSLPEASVVRLADLGEVIASLDHRRDDIVRGLDLVFTGV